MLILLFGVVRWPAWYFHAEMQPQTGQHQHDLLQRLGPNVRGMSQHLSMAHLNKFADVDDAGTCQTFRGARG
jgi:hypothetical protein